MMMLTMLGAQRAGGIDVAELAREHYALVYRFCARRVGEDLAADAAQETFVTAMRAAKRFRGESAPRTWLLGIAHNECRRLSRSRRAEVPLLEFEEPVQLGGEQTMIDRRALEEALNRLSPEHREAVLLHEVEGLTYDEAALMLGVPAGTVKSRVFHAFQHLRKALEPQTEVAS